MSDPATAPRLKWHHGNLDDCASVAGYHLHAWGLPKDYMDGAWAWTIFGNVGSPSPRPAAKGTEPTENAAQCAAEAAVMKLLTEDEGVGLDFVPRDRLTIALERIAELEAAQRWIPLTEATPEPGRTVLLLSPSTERGVPCANVGTGWLMNNAEWMGQMPIAPPTHWKPMPALQSQGREPT